MEQIKLIFDQYRATINGRTNKLFLYLFIVQWIAGIIVSLTITPHTWIGLQYEIHTHVYAAVGIGALINLVPIIFILWLPNSTLTKYVVATGQSLASILLIHLFGGRIETHFHVFGSLAFLSFYRDPKIIIYASAITIIDHLFRGIYFSESVFGIVDSSQLRWLEHTLWVVFEDIFLLIDIKYSNKDMLLRADLEYRLKDTNKQTSIKINKAVKEMNDFNYVLTHELTSSVRSIGTLIQWLWDDFKELYNDEAKESFQELIKRVNRMSQYISGLLAYSKISQGKQTLKKVDTKELCQTIKDRTLNIHKNKNFKIKISEYLPEINYSKTYFNNIIQNIVENSIKYNPEEGLEINIDCHEQGKEFLFTVSDNGVGIDAKHHERIFKIFQILDSKEESDSIGIGLPSVKKMVEVMGGEIFINSEKGHGVEIVFSVPKEQVILTEEKQ